MRRFSQSIFKRPKNQKFVHFKDGGEMHGEILFAQRNENKVSEKGQIRSITFEQKYFDNANSCLVLI